MVKMMLGELGQHSQLFLYGIKFLDLTPSSLFSMLVMTCFCHNKCHKIYKFPIGNIWRNLILMLFDLRSEKNNSFDDAKNKIMTSFDKFQMVHNKR
jgi:hypothetical protein